MCTFFVSLQYKNLCTIKSELKGGNKRFSSVNTCLTWNKIQFGAFLILDTTKNIKCDLLQAWNCLISLSQGIINFEQITCDPHECVWWSFDREIIPVGICLFINFIFRKSWPENGLCRYKGQVISWGYFIFISPIR